MNNSPESQHTKEIKGKLFLLKPRWQTWSLPTPSVTSYSNPHKISPWNPWSLFQKYWLTQPWWQFFNTLLFSYFIDELWDSKRFSLMAGDESGSETCSPDSSKPSAPSALSGHHLVGREETLIVELSLWSTWKGQGMGKGGLKCMRLWRKPNSRSLAWPGGRVDRANSRDGTPCCFCPDDTHLRLCISFCLPSYEHCLPSCLNCPSAISTALSLGDTIQISVGKQPLESRRVALNFRTLARKRLMHPQWLAIQWWRWFGVPKMPVHLWTCWVWKDWGLRPRWKCQAAQLVWLGVGLGGKSVPLLVLNASAHLTDCIALISRSKKFPMWVRLAINNPVPQEMTSSSPYLLPSCHPCHFSSILELLAHS